MNGVLDGGYILKSDLTRSSYAPGLSRKKRAKRYPGRFGQSDPKQMDSFAEISADEVLSADIDGDTDALFGMILKKKDLSRKISAQDAISPKMDRNIGRASAVNTTPRTRKKEKYKEYKAKYEPYEAVGEVRKCSKFMSGDGSEVLRYSEGYRYIVRRAENVRNISKSHAGEENARHSAAKRPNVKTYAKVPPKNQSAGTRQTDAGSFRSRPGSSEENRLEAYRRYMAKKRVMMLHRFVFVSAVSLVALLVMCTVIYKIFFVITNIQVDGLATYSEEEILSAIGVSEGDNLYSFNSDALEKEIMRYFPFVQSVEITRTIPNKVQLSIMEDTPCYYAEVAGETVLLSNRLRVMGNTDEYLYVLNHGGSVPKLKLPSVKKAVAGSVIALQNPSAEQYVRSVANLVANSVLSERITLLSVMNRYDLYAVCDGRYKLILGSQEDLELKLKIASAVLEDSMFRSDNRASVDVSDISETSVIIDNQLSLE